MNLSLRLLLPCVCLMTALSLHAESFNEAMDRTISAVPLRYQRQQGSFVTKQTSNGQFLTVKELNIADFPLRYYESGSPPNGDRQQFALVELYGQTFSLSVDFWVDGLTASDRRDGLTLDTSTAEVFRLVHGSRTYYFWVTIIENPLTGLLLEKYVLLFDVTDHQHVLFYPLATNWFHDGMNIFFASPLPGSLRFVSVLPFDQYNLDLRAATLTTDVEALDLASDKITVAQESAGGPTIKFRIRVATPGDVTILSGTANK